ncbi:hypothetical protein HD554DRAFT_2034407 [Boletus coccyginus]|nr:hypothetical protein HD554DRAFT_2034407 [Boletus coccyginus]
MGNVLSFASRAWSYFFPPPGGENPTFPQIQDRYKAEQDKKQAEDAARAARERAEQTEKEIDEKWEEACAHRKEVDRAASNAAEEAERIRAQMEEALDAARPAKEEAERVQRVADEQRREAETSKALAEEMARTAAEETRKAVEAKEEAERRLKEGIQPVVTPSPEELMAAKRCFQYKEDCFHFAVAGISGSGKSSLVNAFRGLRNRDAGSAGVGVTETTFHTTRYPDANPENPFVWYDIPGAGTLECRDWQYFNDQGLYVFDCIIVLFDNRFTMTDIAILVNARRFNIPTYIVRSKADQHIRNVMRDMGYDSCTKRRASNSSRRRGKVFGLILNGASLPDQRVYIVSNTTISSIVVNKTPKKMIDEVDLFRDLLNEAYSRRAKAPEARAFRPDAMYSLENERYMDVSALRLKHGYFSATCMCGWSEVVGRQESETTHGVNGGVNLVQIGHGNEKWLISSLDTSRLTHGRKRDEYLPMHCVRDRGRHNVLTDDGPITGYSHVNAILFVECASATLRIIFSNAPPSYSIAFKRYGNTRRLHSERMIDEFETPPQVGQWTTSKLNGARSRTTTIPRPVRRTKRHPPAQPTHRGALERANQNSDQCIGSLSNASVQHSHPPHAHLDV